MKAIVSVRQGPPDGLQLREVPTPVPGTNEVLIKVHAATVTAGDVVLRKLPALMFLPMRLFGLKRKRTPGHEFAGEIEAIGPAVTRFKIGDAVFGTTTGLSVGANAEYVCLPEDWSTGVMALKPAHVSYEEAAAAPVGGMTALQLLGRGDIQPGQQVLVYGASGSVGTYAVQLAKAHFGAHVTGVCSTRNMALVESLGAERVIDYTQADYTQDGAIYDVIFDAVGKTTEAKSKPALKPEGRYVSVRASTSEKTEYLLTISELLEAGKIKPVIDRRFPLEETAEAHRYVESGRKAGNVVITVVQEETS
jgi:NADPH:quinone reductase-like Zn-dependent oxidoreductase